MTRRRALIPLLLAVASCGGTPKPAAVEEVVWPSVSGIEFQVCATDGSTLAGPAKPKQRLRVSGSCGLSNVNHKVGVGLVVHIVAPGKDGRLIIYNSANAEATGDDLSHLKFSAEINAPPKAGEYTIQVRNILHQEQLSQAALRVE